MKNCIFVLLVFALTAVAGLSPPTHKSEQSICATQSVTTFHQVRHGGFAVSTARSFEVEDSTIQATLPASLAAKQAYTETEVPVVARSGATSGHPPESLNSKFEPNVRPVLLL